MKKTLYFCIVLGLAFATAQAQQMYRWTDSKGVVHYTEYAPDETREQILNFTADSPQPTKPAGSDVQKLNRMQTTQASLMEIEEKKDFDPSSKSIKASGVSFETAALDPKEMTYCQIIHTNLESFDSLERGDLDQLLLVTQSGTQSRLSADDIQTQYKATIDNLEKYCLQ